MPRRILILAGALIAAAMLAVCAEALPPDPLLQAMRDEVNRSVKLNLPNLEAPYFVQYLLDQSDSFTVSASLGALLGRSRDHFRVPEVEVRVGDYKFDNTNFAGGGGGGSRYDLGNFPLDDSTTIMRCCAATFGWGPTPSIRERWKRFRGSARPCGISIKTISSTILRVPSRCS
jgi:hypothetical protein